MKLNRFLLLFILTITSLFAQKQSYISINAEPKYKEGFAHFDYVNPKAKKGGVVKLSSIGTFDSFNNFILKGNPASGLGLLYDTLMTSSMDEASVMYPLVAEAVEVSDKNDWVKFYINKKARFQKKTPKKVWF